MRFKLIILGISSVLLLCRNNATFSQTLDSIDFNKYNFIQLSKNKIQNDSTSLVRFYNKLSQLEKKQLKKISIVHIGDSHIQADNLSGVVRQKFQHRYGNAGRGLIFPYRAAKSNEPYSYKTTTNTKWDYKRNVFYQKPLPIGISGFTIESFDANAELILTIKDQSGLDYGFTKFSLFHERKENNFDIAFCDSANCVQGIFSNSKNNEKDYVSQIILKNPYHQIILKNTISDSAKQTSTRIYGMLLENDSTGILYNTIGVNGAEYRHYTLSEYFDKQLTFLNPDLIILSMGTNEAYNKGFDKEIFYAQIDSLVKMLRKSNPEADYIFTTPGDSFRKSKKGGVKNPDVKLAQETIIKYCINNNYAYWDLYEIMGGYGSMQKWNVAKLSAKDKVHFSSKGYGIQGTLLYQAIDNAINLYNQKEINK